MPKLVLAVAVVTVLAALAFVQPVRSQPAPPGGPPVLPTGSVPTIPISPPCPPTGCVGTPTPAPTATALPTSTPLPPTVVPLSLSVRLAHGNVPPGGRETVTVTTKRGAGVAIAVTFPNGDRLTHSGKAGTKGKLAWSFTQAGSEITHSNRAARVRVTARSAGASRSASKSYTVGFGRIDVSAEPRTQSRGHTIAVWVHGPAFMRLGAQVGLHGRSQNFSGRAGGGGWVQFSYRVPASAATGSGTARGYSLARNYAGQGTTTFRVR